VTVVVTSWNTVWPCEKKSYFTCNCMIINKLSIYDTNPRVPLFILESDDGD
jgi:hypothetical protein